MNVYLQTSVVKRAGRNKAAGNDPAALYELRWRILKHDLRCELHDARTGREGRESEWVGRRNVLQRELRRNTRHRGCGHCIVGIANTTDIASIEQVERLGDELEARAGENPELLGQARVNRELARQAERVAGKAGS